MVVPADGDQIQVQPVVGVTLMVFLLVVGVIQILRPSVVLLVMAVDTLMVQLQPQFTSRIMATVATDKVVPFTSTTEVASTRPETEALLVHTVQPLVDMVHLLQYLTDQLQLLMLQHLLLMVQHQPLMVQPQLLMDRHRHHTPKLQ